MNATSITTQFILNSSHYFGNNVFKYTLPQGRSIRITNNHSVAVSSCSIYNSTFNIKASWGNNRILLFSEKLILANIPTSSEIRCGNSYTDPVSGLVIAKKYVEFLINDGYWDIPSLDAYFQNKCQLIGLYLQTTDNSSNSYFFEAITNPQRYSCQINCFLIPSAAAPTGYLVPSNACYSLDGVASSLQVYFPSVSDNSKYGSLGRIFGFKKGVTLPLDNNILIESQNLSQVTPVVSPVTTYLIGCNLVNNEYSIPSDVILQLNLGDSKFGGIVKYDQQLVYVTCQPQQASSIVITLYDENFNPLEIQDSQFSLVLSIKEEIQRQVK